MHTLKQEAPPFMAGRMSLTTFYGIQKLRCAAENRARDSSHDKWKCLNEECKHIIWIGKASHTKRENHSQNASQARDETQQDVASQELIETHNRTASQLCCETQRQPASHMHPETHGERANTQCPECGGDMRFFSKLGIDEIVELEAVAKELIAVEKKRLSYFQREVEKTEIWHNFFLHVKGIGPVLSAGLISYNIPRFKSISAAHKYFGFYPCARRKKGELLSYNPKAKVLLWKVCVQFIKLKPEKSFYRRMYDVYKAEEVVKPICEKCKKKHPKATICSKGHIHNRTIRKLGRLFLSHLWLQWRALENMPVSEPYPIAILGHSGYIVWEPDGKKETTDGKDEQRKP